MAKVGFVRIFPVRRPRSERRQTQKPATRTSRGERRHSAQINRNERSDPVGISLLGHSRETVPFLCVSRHRSVISRNGSKLQRPVKAFQPAFEKRRDPCDAASFGEPTCRVRF